MREHQRSDPAAVAIAVAIGALVAAAAAVMPHPVRLHGVDLGDIGLPLAGIEQMQHGGSPYDVRLRGSSPTLYPFTAMIVLWPLHLLPLRFVVPLFTGLTAGALAFAITRNGERWQLLIFLSPAFWSAVHSVQWSPLFTAALLLPPLLPIAVVKPQLGIVLAASGRWSLRTILATGVLLVLSMAVWPAWPAEWIAHGNLHTFNGASPLLVFPGILLAASLVAWRTREGRLMISMSVVVQRYFYDHLPLYLVARSWREMVLLLAASWAAVGVAALHSPIDLTSGVQRKDVWVAVIIGVFLPALGLTLYHHWRPAAPAPTG